MPIFRSIRLYTLYTTAYGIQHCIMKPPTNTQVSFTVLNAIGSSIQSIQPNTPEDGHVDARNM